MSKAKKSSVFNFEKDLTDLEKIVERMEQGNTTLEESLDQFERAIELLKNCQTTLKEAKVKVQILLNKNQKDVLLPFEIEEGGNEEFT